MNRQGPGWVEIGLSFLVFVVVVGGLFHPVSLGGRTVSSAPNIPFTLPDGPVGFEIDPEDPIPLADAWGPGLIHEANLLYRVRALNAGRLPLWHPHEACGNPYLAGYLPGLFFPPNWLMYVGKPPLGIDLVYLARLVLAGWLTFLFLRVHRIGRMGAFISGILYLGCGYMVSSLNLSNAAVEAQIPGLLLGIECLLSRGRRRDLVLATCMVAGVLLGGNPQPAFLAFVLGGVYAAIRVSTLPRSTWPSRLGLFAAAHGLGLMLAAPQVLPFLEFLSLASHIHEPGLNVRGAPWELLIVWVVPGFYRHAYTSNVLAQCGGFYGVATFGWMLALAGFSLRRNRALTLLGGAATLIIGALYFGLPGDSFLYDLPVINRIDIQKYVAAHLCFLPAVLAGIGFDHLVRLDPGRMIFRLAAAGIGIGLVPVVFVVLWLRGDLAGVSQLCLRLDPGDPVVPSLGGLWIAAMGAALDCVALGFRPGWSRWILLALAGLLLVEVAYHMPDDYPPRRDIFRPPEFLAGIQGDRRTFRVYSPGAVLSPNTAGIFGLNDIRYTEAMKIERYVRLVEQGFSYPRARDYSAWTLTPGVQPGAPARALTVLGVRYLLCTGEMEAVGRPPVNGGCRQDIALDLRDSAYDLVGELEAPEGKIGRLDVWLEDRESATIIQKKKLTAAAGVAEVVLKSDSVPAGVFYYLGVDVPACTTLSIRSVHWCGRPVSPDGLRTGVHDRTTVSSSGAVHLTAPTAIALPAVQSTVVPELTIQGRVSGRPVTIALVTENTRHFGAIESDPATATGGGERFRLDLSALAGEQRLLSLVVDRETRLVSLGIEPRCFIQRHRFGPVRVFEHTRPLPRAFGIHRVKVVLGEDAQLHEVLDPDFPIRTTAVVDRLPDGIELPEEPPPSLPAVNWISEDPGGGRVELESRFAADGLVVLHDNHYPGWQAFVDGNRATLLRANYCFRAVPVPAGVHRVEFRFVSLWWRLGLLAAAAGLIGLVFLLWRWPAGRRPY